MGRRYRNGPSFRMQIKWTSMGVEVFGKEKILFNGGQYFLRYLSGKFSH